MTAKLTRSFVVWRAVRVSVDGRGAGLQPDRGRACGSRDRLANGTRREHPGIEDRSTIPTSFRLKPDTTLWLKPDIRL